MSRLCGSQRNHSVILYVINYCLLILIIKPIILPTLVARHVNTAGCSVKPSVKPYHWLLHFFRLLPKIITLITLPTFTPFQQGQPQPHNQRPSRRWPFFNICIGNKLSFVIIIFLMIIRNLLFIIYYYLLLFIIIYYLLFIIIYYYLLFIIIYYLLLFIIIYYLLLTNYFTNIHDTPFQMRLVPASQPTTVTPSRMRTPSPVETVNGTVKTVKAPEQNIR